MITPSQPVIPVVAGLVFRSGRLLVTQRPAGVHLAGLWEFPGGKKDPGESSAEALERELMEELGVEVEVGTLYSTIEHSYPEKSVRLEFFLCALRSGEPHPLGCSDLAWVTRTELENYEFPAADSHLLLRLQGDASLNF